MTTKRRKQAWLPLIALVTVSVLGIGDAPVSAVSIPVKLTRQTVSLTIEKSKSGTRYGTKKVTIKKAKGIKIKKVTCKVKKKSIAKVSVTGKSAPKLTVKAKKQGSTKVAISVRYQKSGKTNIKKLTLNVKVTLNP